MSVFEALFMVIKANLKFFPATARIGSTWGANAKTLRTAGLAIVYSSAEYVTPVWSRSCHTKKLDVSLNDTMRIITGCVKPTPTHAAEHHNCEHDIIEARNEEWTKHQRPKQLTLTQDTSAPPGSDLPRKLWVTLNRLRAGVGRFGAEMHKWGLRTSASYACGAATQNAEHIYLIAISFVHLTPSRTSLT